MSADRCRELDDRLRGPRRLKDINARRAWYATLTGVEDCIAAGLAQYSEAEDWWAFDSYVLAAFHLPSRLYTATLCQVLSRKEAEGNYEDIVDVLAEIRDPASVGCLRDLLWWEPPWDEFRNLAVKSIWALAAIGTPEALAAIREVEEHDAVKMREAAKHMLHRPGR